MIIEILFVVTMFLWFLTGLPVQQMEGFAGPARNWLGFVAVLLLGLAIYGGFRS